MFKQENKQTENFFNDQSIQEPEYAQMHTDE